MAARGIRGLLGGVTDLSGKGAALRESRLTTTDGCDRIWDAERVASLGWPVWADRRRRSGTHMSFGKARRRGPCCSCWPGEMGANLSGGSWLCVVGRRTRRETQTDSQTDRDTHTEQTQLAPVRHGPSTCPASIAPSEWPPSVALSQQRVSAATHAHDPLGLSRWLLGPLERR